MHHSVFAEHTSRMGLDDAYSIQLARVLSNVEHPAEALKNLRWTIPDQEALKAMAPHERIIALVPIVSIVISKLTRQLSLNDSIQAELVAEGCGTLTELSLEFANNIKSYAWKAVHRKISKRLDLLKQPQVILGGGSELEIDYEIGMYVGGDPDRPLNGELISGQFPKPFTDWSGIYPALRALFDICQDDIDRSIIKARWANNRCVTEGYLTPVDEIAELVGVSDSDVHERLQRLYNRWRCYINRTKRFPRHLPAILPRAAH